MDENGSTYQQQAYRYIKNQITNRGFRPGEYITDAQIAGALNISRTPVREAMHRLENERLLVYEARRGWKVYALSLQDIHEIFDLKVVVEGMAARKAAECQDETLCASLKAAFEQMLQAAQAGDNEAWMEADAKIHHTIFEMAGNERARSLIQNLNDQWNRLRIGFDTVIGRTGRSSEEHRPIIENILAGNGEQAEGAMQRHLNLLREELVSVLVNMVLPFVEDGV